MNPAAIPLPGLDIDDPAYADDGRDLKEDLLRIKELYGDHDEGYPDLMAIRRGLRPESVEEVP